MEQKSHVRSHLFSICTPRLVIWSWLASAPPQGLFNIVVSSPRRTHPQPQSCLVLDTHGAATFMNDGDKILRLDATLVSLLGSCPVPQLLSFLFFF